VVGLRTQRRVRAFVLADDKRISIFHAEASLGKHVLAKSAGRQLWIEPPI
jgi:hypothetical protein